MVIPGFLRDLLAEHLAGHGAADSDALVFPSPASTPMRRGNFHRRLWRPAIEAVGLDGLRVHDLRHTCAALLIAENAHPKAVQTHLGHSSIQVTMDRYGHLFPSDADELAGRLDATRRRTVADIERADGASEAGGLLTLDMGTSIT